MAVSSVGGGWRLLCEYHWKVNLPIRLPNTTLFLQNPKPRRTCCVVARALDPKTGGDQNSTNSSAAAQVKFVICLYQFYCKAKLILLLLLYVFFYENCIG